MKNVAYLLLLLAAVLTGSPAQAQPGEAPRPLTTSGGEAQLAALVAKSPVIIEGHAEEGYCFWDADHRQIYTATPITVYKVFKGEVSSARIEIITRGGQVGNSGSGSKAWGPGFALHPTGMLFLEPAAHPDPKTKTLTSQVFRVVDGEAGFFRYEGMFPDFDKTQSRWQLYLHLETSLYPAIVTQVGHPYRTVKPFNPKTYNYFRERRFLDSVRYVNSLSYFNSQLVPSAPGGKKKLPAKPSINGNQLRGSGQPTAPTISRFFSSFTPNNTVNAGTFDSLTIIGSGFGNPSTTNPGLKPLVQFLNADDLSTYINTPPENIIRFSDTQIVLYVPSNNGANYGLGQGAASGNFKVTGVNGVGTAISATPVIIPRSEFTLNYSKDVNGTRVYLLDSRGNKAYRQLRLINRDRSRGLRFRYDASVLNHRLSSAYGNTPTTKVIEAVIRKWRRETRINLGDSVFQAVPFSTDSVNCNITFGTSPIAALMETTQTYSYCLTRSGTGTITSIYVFVTAIDILIDKRYKWSYDLTNTAIPVVTPPDSGRFDFKSVLLHELGHGVGLDHVADPTKAMYRSFAATEQRYYLSAEPERNGGANILRRSVLTGRCYPPMIPLDTTSVPGNWQGAQISLNPYRLFYDICNPPPTQTVTASGGTSYRWKPATAFISPNANPNAATVTFPHGIAAPYVYAMKDGLGDFLRTVYKPLPCSPPPASTGGGELRTQVYPNPTSSTFKVQHIPATNAEHVESTLYNAQGTAIHTHRWESGAAGLPQTQELPQVPAGTYFLRTVTNGKTSEVLQLRAE